MSTQCQRWKGLWPSPLYLLYWGRWRTQSRDSYQRLVSASLPLLDFTYPQRIGTWCDKLTILALKFNVHCIPKCKHHCCWCITHANKEIHLPVTVAIATFFWCLEVTTMNKYHIQRLGMYTEIINKQCIGSKLSLLSFETSALNDYVMIVMTS